MTEEMARLQKRTRNLGPAFHMVSFTVDPLNDTSQKLNAYARSHHANPRAWSFLTGTDEALMPVREQALAGMKGVGPGRHRPGGVPGEAFFSRFHGTYTLLVDGERRIRGYYDISDQNGLDRMVADLAVLINRGD
jgi:protein SCO1/2